MIITCEECSSSFSVNDSLIKETGSKVRCSKCDSVFVAYPQPAEDIAELETAEEDLILDSGDQMLGEDEDLGLDDLDSDLGDFLSDEEADEALAMSADSEESELDLADFDDTLDSKTGPASDDVLEETEGDLELDLDFDQDDDSDLALEEESIAGDDLPDLDGFEDLADLDDEELTTGEDVAELENLDLELESEADAELELEGDDEPDLTNLELEQENISALEEPSAEEEDALNVEGSDELDLSDLEIAIDGEKVSEISAGSVSEELNLDLETEEPLAEEIAGEDLSLETADELDLSDLDLDMEDASAPEEVSATGSDDLDLDLELDLEDETVGDSEDIAADELDLSDLTDIVEEEAAPESEGQSQDLDFDLDLESDDTTPGDEPAAVADSGEIDSLDLSDLEDIMQTEEAPAAQAAADDSAQDLEKDFDLQIDDDVQTNAALADQGGDELDFSDLEQMLESDEKPSLDASDTIDDEELDLQFDLDEPPAASADVAGADVGAEGEDTDFLDIEQLLEDGEDGGPAAGAELDGDVTDLPLEMEAALDDASKGADAELELDFDLESELQAKEDLFDTDESNDQDLESNLLISDEVDFLDEAGVEETEFQNVSETSVVGTDDFTSDELTETSDAYGATHVLPDSEDQLPLSDALDQAPVAHKPPKTRSKKPVLVVVLLFILAIGVIIIPNMLGIKIPYISDIKIPYLSDLDVKIPYLSDWLNPEPQDVAGNLKIIPLGNTIDGKFVDNARSGQLFVIRGQIQNDYDHPRSYIKVTGKLYQKGKKIAKVATVYCGNILSDSDLSAMDITAINKKLHTRTGDKRSNFKVNTGKTVPFMIVFDKLPGNLDEYTVEVEGSSI